MPSKEYMREYRARKKAEAPQENASELSEVPTLDAQAFEERWRRAGYSEWPPPWREIIPKLTDEQITGLLDKMPKLGKTWK